MAARRKKLPPQCWHLPRPSKVKYKGAFPLNFEPKIKKILETDNILHVFAGGSTLGLTLDIQKTDTGPMVMADAHKLPFRDHMFDAVLADPPYSDQYAKDLYNTPKLKMSKAIKEMVRVLKPGGIFAYYHLYPIGRPKGCRYLGVITIITRFYHVPRVVTLFEKKINWQEDPKEDEETLLMEEEKTLSSGGLDSFMEQV